MNRRKDETKMMKAAEKIRIIREAFHMNRSEFAESLGISSALVSCMEKGKANVSRKTTLILENKYCINPTWLLYDTGRMFIRDDITIVTIMNDHPVLKKLADSHEQKLRAADEKIINCLTAKEKRAELKKEAAERLKQFRNAYKMSQNQLAKQIGYTRAHISAIEKGLDRPSKQMADKIENEFGISANWLLYGTAA